MVGNFFFLILNIFCILIFFLNLLQIFDNEYRPEEILVMTFEGERIILCQYPWPVVIQKFTYVSMAERELI